MVEELVMVFTGANELNPMMAAWAEIADKVPIAAAASMAGFPLHFFIHSPNQKNRTSANSASTMQIAEEPLVAIAMKARNPHRLVLSKIFEPSRFDESLAIKKFDRWSCTTY
jgi:hypothetical protein